MMENPSEESKQEELQKVMQSGKQQRVILISWIVELKLNALDIINEKIALNKVSRDPKISYEETYNKQKEEILVFLSENKKDVHQATILQIILSHGYLEELGVKFLESYKDYVSLTKHYVNKQ